MINSLSFLTSLETPSKLSFSAEFSGEEEAGKSAFDGFANLLDQLVQIAPIEGDGKAVGLLPPAAQEALAASGKESGKESGKILPVLPVLPVSLPGLASLQAFGAEDDAPLDASGTPKTILDTPASMTAKIVELPVGRLDAARLAQGAALAQATPSVSAQNPAADLTTPTANVLPVEPKISPAANLATLPAASSFGAPGAASPVAALVAASAVSTASTTASPVGIPAAVSPFATGATASPVGTLAAASALSTASTQSLTDTPVSAITIAAAPTTSVAMSARVEKAAVVDLPVSASETARRILSTGEDAPTPAPVPATRAVLATSSETGAQTAAAATALSPMVAKSDAKPGPVAQAAALAPVASAKTEGEADTARPVEAVQAPTRLAAPAEMPRVEPAIAAPNAPASTPTGTEAITRAADLARPDAFAAIDSIARMVDRLSAARDFGVVPTAAMAVMHKEFGELSIAIDRISDTLQVEVAAKDGEAQRALAAALANERAAALAGDRGPQRSFEAQQGAAQGHTNGNGAGQSAAGADRGTADTSGQAASNNGQSQREGQGRERTRPEGQPLHARNPAASDRPSASDDGRYA